MRHSYLLGAFAMTHVIIGFIIALAVGLTGIGGGSFTVPALLLIAGLPAAEAVGTTFVFAGVLRLIAAPFYLAARQVHPRYVRLLLQGAVPGLVLGMIALRIIAKQESSPLLIIVIGLLLTLSSSVSFVPRAQVPEFARKNSAWLPWLAFPIGVESGFSSAGAGALGTVLLFGLVLAVVGSAVHWTFGSISTPLLVQLLLGGIPGVVLGCVLSRRVPAQRLKAVMAVIALAAGLQLVWSGARGIIRTNGANAAQAATTSAKAVR